MLYIALGSNIGNRIENLRKAVNLLSKHYLQDITTSMVIETEAILPTNNTFDSWNKSFLNMIVAGKTDLSPKNLLKGLKSIESEMGRGDSYEKWSPRIIDLDILIWDDLKINSPSLTIPHPELVNRPFLLHLLSLMGVKRSELPQTHLTSRPKNLFTKSFVLKPEFIGIVNITSDSFSDGGMFDKTDKAIKQILKLSSDGASIIEIGAQSTRPEATIHNANDEYDKLKPVLDGVAKLMEKKIINISVDTFWPQVVAKLLKNYPIYMINNVKNMFDNNTLKIILANNCQLCSMHSIGIPPTKDKILPLEKEPIDIIKNWGKSCISQLLKLGFDKKQIILDPGIGFGKSMYQNIDILKNIAKLKSLDVKIMIGHSRKSYINAFSSINATNRDIETIAISALIKNKVDFLRVHNVENHMRFLATYHNFH